jgi:hypothetical protein
MNLVDLVFSASGMRLKPAHPNSREYVGPCPFCGEGRDRFHVWLEGKERFWCRVCNRKGDTIDFVMEYKNLRFGQALTYLKDIGANVRLSNALEMKPLPPPQRPQVALTHSAIDAWHKQGRARAVEYYSQWKLTGQAIDNNNIGWHRTDRWCGYTIPHYWLGPEGTVLKGVKIRKDERNAPDWMPKYFGLKQSTFGGAWNAKWVSNPDDTRMGPHIGYVLITEAEKDAALLDDLGYPAIAYTPEAHWDAHLGAVFQRVEMPVIIADADGGRGMERARKIRKLLRDKPPIISTEKWDVKQPSDLAALYGAGAITDWLKSTGLDLERIA